MAAMTIKSNAERITVVESRTEALENIKAHGRLKRVERSTKKTGRFIRGVYVAMATVSAVAAFLYWLEWWGKPSAMEDDPPAHFSAAVCETCLWEPIELWWHCEECYCTEDQE